MLPDSARPKVSGYSEAGASLVRRAMKGFKAQSGSPNEDINYNNLTLRQRGRMLYMSSPLATSAINTNRTKVVGVGLTLKSSINREVLGLSPEAAKDWQRKTEAEFHLWADHKQNCDAIGMNNFDALQQLALVSWLMSGDVFPIFKRYNSTPTSPYSLRIHMVEADRISTPNHMGGRNGFISITDGKNPENGNRIFDGVEVNSDGMVVAYHVCNSYPWQVIREPQKWTRVEAYGARTGLPNILHVMNSERCDQYRGVTYLAQVIEPLLQLRRYTESELMAALVQSFFTAWIITKTEQTGIPVNETGMGDIAGVPTTNPGGDNISNSPNEYEQGLVCYQSYSYGSYVEPGTTVEIKVSLGSETVTYKYNASIEGPTPEEAPDYVVGTSVGVTIVADNGKVLLDTTTTTFPLAANHNGIPSSKGMITFTYTVTTPATTTTNESGETVTIPGTTESRSFTRAVEFVRE